MSRTRTRTPSRRRAPAHERSTLPNGLRVVSQTMPHARSVAVALFVGVGSRHETAGEAGLSHMVSTIACQTRPEIGLREIFEATFPPGSVTGAPKLAALAHIARLETAPRGVYCGAVGRVDADARRGELNVAIRTFWVEDGRLHFGTGGGITWDSTPEGEWAETELKARRLLAVASRGTTPAAAAHRR